MSLFYQKTRKNREIREQQSECKDDNFTVIFLQSTKKKNFLSFSPISGVFFDNPLPAKSKQHKKHKNSEKTLLFVLLSTKAGNESLTPTTATAMVW